jgi:hypothetical protein
VIPALLCVLAVVDATFAGFRAAAGRDARIFKRAYYRRALGIGAAAGLAEVGLLAALTGAATFASGDAAALYAELLAIGARMLHVILAYAVLVLGALALYATARLELRTLATVTVLGPLTLIRPLVVVAATAWGVAVGCSTLAVLLTVVSSATVLLVGWFLDRAWGLTAGSRRRARP